MPLIPTTGLTGSFTIYPPPSQRRAESYRNDEKQTRISTDSNSVRENSCNSCLLSVSVCVHPWFSVGSCFGADFVRPPGNGGLGNQPASHPRGNPQGRPHAGTHLLPRRLLSPGRED